MYLSRLTLQLREFARERHWEQFHSPKNLSMALSVEVAELLEHFQWLTETQSSSLDSKTLYAVSEEIADIQIYLARIADVLGVDIGAAVEAKIVSNSVKYPANEVCGSARKRSEKDNSADR